MVRPQASSEAMADFKDALDPVVRSVFERRAIGIRGVGGRVHEIKVRDITVPTALSLPRVTLAKRSQGALGLPRERIWWAVRDLNPRRRSRLVYSQIPLATRATTR